MEHDIWLCVFKMESDTIIQILIFLVLTFQAIQLYLQYQLNKKEKQKSEKKLIIEDIEKKVFNTNSHYVVKLYPEISILNPSNETNTIVKIKTKCKNKDKTFNLFEIDENGNRINKKSFNKIIPIYILAQQAKIINLHIDHSGLELEYDLNNNLNQSKEVNFKIYIEDVRGNPYEKDYIVELKP